MQQKTNSLKVHVIYDLGQIITIITMLLVVNNHCGGINGTKSIKVTTRFLTRQMIYMISTQDIYAMHEFNIPCQNTTCN